MRLTKTAEIQAWFVNDTVSMNALSEIDTINTSFTLTYNRIVHRQFNLLMWNRSVSGGTKWEIRTRRFRHPRCRIR